MEAVQIPAGPFRKSAQDSIDAQESAVPVIGVAIGHNRPRQIQFAAQQLQAGLLLGFRGHQLQPAIVLGLGGVHRRLQRFDPAYGAIKRTGVGTVVADMLGAETLDQLKRFCSWGIGRAGGDGALEMSLQDLGTADDVEQLALLDPGGGQEAAPVQAQPHRSVEAAFVDDLVGIIPVEVHVGGAAIDAVSKFLPQFNVSSIL